ncbi:hypothetical protein Sango_1941400 [Sesamum angolense]|uniref:Reverse transcriptase domain-containing protein n=1 Tax=Sesamum angolense TaxID=2727404 RepID=A0AAE1WEC9_9LAMI|nr:hypothetical protein Sango_1941400 [Sesamum angolense]
MSDFHDVIVDCTLIDVTHLELSKSDHRGLLVETEYTMERKVSSFQFQHMWTTHSGFHEVEWNKTVFGNVFDRVAVPERQLKETDETYDHDPCDRTLVEWNWCSVELVRVLAQEKVFLRQNAGIKWAKDGEQNTRYFHSLSGFVPGRLLSDSVLLVQELIHSLESRRPEANMVFKLDMAKAYDRVSWDFLYQVLRKRVSHSAGLPWWLMLS